MSNGSIYTEYFISPRIPGVRPADPPDYDGVTFVYVFTQVLDFWTVPPVQGNVTVVVANAQGFLAGMTIAIEGAGYFQVVSTDVLNRMTIENGGYAANQPPGTAIAPGKVTTTSLPGPPIAGPPGPNGPQGIQGNPGPPLNARGTVSTASALPSTGNTVGDLYTTADTGHAYSWNGTSWIDMGPFQGPPGIQGVQGVQGPVGNTGPIGPAGTPATVAVGTTSTLPPGSSATVADVGSPSNSVLNFGIPAGQTGVTGATGATGSQGSQGPIGPSGGTGPAGTAATIAVGTTTTGAPGTNASVNNSGTANAATFNFTIPQGIAGATGATGSQGPSGNTGAAGTAATIAAGTATGLPAGSNPTVSNSGSSSAAVFNFGIPAGQTGAVGATGATGSQGPVGNAGVNGQPAYTLSTGGFTVPPVGSTVIVNVQDTSWVALNEVLWIQDAGGPGVAGPMQVTAITSTSLTLLNIATSQGAAPASNPVFIGLSGVTTAQTVDCTNATSVSGLITFTAGFTLTLANLGGGVPVSMRFTNTSSGSLTVRIAATDPTGTAYARPVTGVRGTAGPVNFTTNGVAIGVNLSIQMVGISENSTLNGTGMLFLF